MLRKLMSISVRRSGFRTLIWPPILAEPNLFHLGVELDLCRAVGVGREAADDALEVMHAGPELRPQAEVGEVELALRNLDARDRNREGVFIRRGLGLYLWCGGRL